jgi:hypothetical protein
MALLAHIEALGLLYCVPLWGCGLGVLLPLVSLFLCRASGVCCFKSGIFPECVCSVVYMVGHFLIGFRMRGSRWLSSKHQFVCRSVIGA